MKNFFLCILFLFLIPPFLYPQSKAEKIDELIKAYENYGMFTGTALVSDKGKVILKDGYGYANIEWEVPNTPDAKFRVGSVTKQFTSMIIMQLVQEGMLDLQKNISDYLSYYPEDKGEKITIHHLLTHTSGIPNYTNFPEFIKDQARNAFMPEDFVKTFMNKELDFEPGEKMSYSNSGYFLLGEIIEKITGKSYEENLRGRIFDPLGMNDSGYDHNDQIMKRRASGYSNGIISSSNAMYIDLTTPFSAGAVYSTVKDLYKWDRALYTEQLLSDELKKIMFTADKNGFAYGWRIGSVKLEDDSVNTIAHGGSIFGFTALVIRLIDDKSFIVLLSNNQSSKLQEMGEKIVRILYDNQVELPSEPLVRSIAELITEEGIETAEKFYREQTAAGNSVNENEMNSLGYELLRGGKLEEAIAIFRLNVEAHPESFNVYDSYGEALLAAGRKDEAMENYKKSVEINPGNENGIKVLKDLGIEISAAEDYKMTDEIFSKYAGRYELNPGFIIEISSDNNKYFAQASNQPKLEIHPQTENKFYIKEIQAFITFQPNGDADYDSMLLEQQGQKVTLKRIN